MRNKRPCFVGIDLAFAKKKYLPVVICTWEQGRLIPKPLRHLGFTPPCGRGNAATLDQNLIDRFAEETRLYIQSVCDLLELNPLRIGIDAPSAPRNPSIKRRLAEAGLDRASISCFATPSANEFDVIRNKVRKHLAEGGEENRIPHANQLWMLVGFAIFEELSKISPCLEVFPQATARVLGAGQIHKSQPGAIEIQFTAASRYTGWLPNRADGLDLGDISWGDRHDQLDAYLSAWVASLNEADRMAYGEPPNDAIWVPKIQDCTAGISVDVPTKVNPVDKTLGDSAPKLLCPACGKKEFKQWPLGWDAHAVHKCDSLTATEPEARKSEYRQKYLNKPLN